MGTFYFFVGIPGSGKSHFAAQLAIETVAVIVCPDEIRKTQRVRSERAFEIAREEIEKHLKAGRDVIFDATNTIRRWRQQNIMAGKSFATRVVAVVLDTPLQLCLDRQRRRAEQGEKTDLPESVIRRMADQLADNLPELAEGFDEIRTYAGIIMTMNSGEFAGQTRQLFLDQVDPMDLLASAVRHGWHWELNYSWATPFEISVWLDADMICRSELAKREGRPVHFDGQEYVDLKKWRDAIASSGQNVSVDRDDLSGFWVKSVGPEPTKH